MTWALYLDECGQIDRHSLPLESGQTPVFCVAGVALPLDRWREYDREYLNLKRQFFKKEIDDSSKPDTRWEIKGNNLIAPRNSRSERNITFTHKVVDLIKKYDGRIFGCIFIKCPKKPTPKSTMYTKAVQIIDERFDIFLRERDEKGLLILDSRMAHMKKGSGADYTVAVSHLSFVFGNDRGRELKRIKEAPLFADSCLTVGLQIADLVAAQMYAFAYREKLSSIAEQDANGYLDYSHTERFRKSLREVEFRSENKYGGHIQYGTKTLDHRRNSAGPRELIALKQKYEK